MKRDFFRSLFCVALLLPGFPGTWICADTSGPTDAVWIEGEAPTSVDPASIQPTVESGPTSILSGGKALKIGIESDQVEAQIPDNGVTLNYAAQIAQAGDDEIWIHVGYEQARCLFDWRIDQGDWQAVDPATPTVDVQELGVWQPYAWLHLGKQALAAGSHTFQLRLHKGKDGNGKPARFLFGCDAICLTAGVFHPDGGIQPGDPSWQSDKDKAAAAQVFAINDAGNGGAGSHLAERSLAIRRG